MSFSKKSIQLLLICTIGIGLLVYLCGCGGFSGLRTEEGFAGWQGTSPRPAAPIIGEEDVAPLRKQLEGLFVTAGEALCPSFTMVRDEIAKGKKGASAEEKNKAAVAQMQKEAGGKIYDCRSYPDHLQVPADIGSIIQSTAVYLDKKLGGLLERVEAALSCKPLPVEEGDVAASNDYDPVTVPPELRESFQNGATVEHYRDMVEYYADVCTPEQMTVRKKDAEEKAARAGASACAAPDEISFAQQKVLLETRIKNIEKVLKDAEWAPRIKRVQDTLRRFQEIKAKVDAGTLVPNCGAGF